MQKNKIIISTYFKTLALLFFSITIFFLCIEIFIRILGYKTYQNDKKKLIELNDVFSLIENYKKPFNVNILEDLNRKDTAIEYERLNELKYSFKIRSNGTRYCGIDYNNNNRDINLYGCSFTFGIGLDDTTTHAYYLQKMFPNYNINNYGTSGYGMAEIYFKILKTINYKTKVVIINYAHFQTDRLPNSQYFAKMKNQYLSKNLINYLNKNSIINSVVLYNHTVIDTIIPYVKYNEKIFQNHVATINLLDDIYNEFYERKKLHKLEISYLLLKKINEICKTKNITLILTNIDGYKQTNKDLEYFSNIGIKKIDLKIKNNDKKFNLQPNDNHPNQLANKLFAERIGNYLNIIINK